MDETDPNQVPTQIESRVRRSPDSFLARDIDLTEKCEYGDEISHEPVKAIQKEIDGMARLLCALVDVDENSDNISQYLRIYNEEVGNLHDLERDVISELPERE
jgi:hypothetical protein